MTVCGSTVVHHQHSSSEWLAAQQESVNAYRDAQQAAWLQRHRGSIGVTASEGRLYTRLMMSSSSHGPQQGHQKLQMMMPEPVRVGIAGDERSGGGEQLGFRDAAISLLLLINEAANFHLRRQQSDHQSNQSMMRRWTNLRTDLLDALELHHECYQKLSILQQMSLEMEQLIDDDEKERKKKKAAKTDEVEVDSDNEGFADGYDAVEKEVTVTSSSSNRYEKKKEVDQKQKAVKAKHQHLKRLLDATSPKQLAKMIAKRSLFMDE